MPDLFCFSSSRTEAAELVAERFGLNLVHNPDLSLPAGFHLVMDERGVALQEGEGGKARVEVDFAGGANAHRRRFGGGKGQDIAKAVGVTGKYQPSVIDATAGLGRDSFVLASLGCRVTACERNPVVAALLADGLQRAMDDAEAAEIVSRIELKFGAVIDLIQPSDKPSEQPDIVYLDPMFGEDAKGSAQVKKDMQAFRQVVGSDMDADDLLEWALACARCRVVIKRGRKAAPLAGVKPGYEITGKSNRFDVFSKARVEALN